MKRLILSCALIGATFACNAMNPGAAQLNDEQKYRYIKHLEICQQLTVKEVNEKLVDNNYVMNHLTEFLEYALKTRRRLSGEIEGISNFIENSPNTPFARFGRLYTNNLLGRIRIIEIAHDVCNGVRGHDQLKIEDLAQPKAQLEELLALVE